MFIMAMVAIIITMVLALVRAILRPTVFDRILAVNLFGTKTVLLIAVMGFLRGQPDFIDLALIYVLINFIGTVVILKYVEYRNFATSGVQN